jgi:hypothetical protein
MKRTICSMALAFVSACGMQPSSVGPEVDQAGLADSGKGVAVIGLSVDRLGGICDLNMGRAGSGSISTGIGAGWSEGDGETVYGSKTLEAGGWDLYQISCGNAMIHRTKSAKVLGFLGTAYDPLARFEIAAGETVYLGDLEIERIGGAFGIVRLVVADNSEGARQAVATSAPQLAADMQTRLIEIIPRE